MDIRLASDADVDPITVAAYLRGCANVTGTRYEELVAELERWSALDAGAGRVPGLDQYLRHFGGTREKLERRLRGFRQATGVPPQRFVELKRESGINLLDLKITPLPDEPGPSSTEDTPG